MRWRNADSVIKRKGSEKEKNKHRILRHMYMEYRKMVRRNLFRLGWNMDADIENRLVDRQGEEEGGTN